MKLSDTLLDHPSNSLLGKGYNMLMAFCFMFLWTLTIASILHTLNPYPLPSLNNPVTEPKQYTFFISCLVAPIWEEFTFRWAPLNLARTFGKNTLLPIVIISSATFGLGHGEGQVSILYQGVSGLIFSILFLRNNYAILPNIFVHFLWNFCCLFIF